MCEGKHTFQNVKCLTNIIQILLVVILQFNLYITFKIKFQLNGYINNEPSNRKLPTNCVSY